MNGLTIITECYIDTTLIEVITSRFNQFNHQKGCSAVAKLMQGRLRDSFAVGIIDKDKREISYLEEFDLISAKDSLFLYKHKEKPHYIIQISPAIERFFLKAADEMGVDVGRYGFPDELGKLTKITKQISGKDENVTKKFKELFYVLSDATELSKLAKLILYLGEKTYQADMEGMASILRV